MVAKAEIYLFFQSTLIALAESASDQSEADRLRYLASPSGKVLKFHIIQN